MEMLKEKEVRDKLKEGKPGKHSDGKGLYLQIGGPGRASWTVQYRLGGQTKWTSIGSAFDYGLPEARAAHKEIRRKAQAGIDPKGAGRLAFVASPSTAPAGTSEQTPAGIERRLFADVVEMFLMVFAPTWRGGLDGPEAKTYRKTLMHGALAKLFADAITTDDVEAALAEWKDKPPTADKVRMRISKVMNFAKAKKYRTGDNPASKDIFDNLLPEIPKAISHPNMKSADVPALMRELIARGTMDARALAFTILTAARSGETIGATWLEIDIKNAVWEVPASRMKEGEKHRVALSSQAIKLLGKPGAPNDYIFQNSKGGKLWVSAMRELLRVIRPGVTVHGFRATFSGDWALKNGFPPEFREMALAHAVSDAVFAKYNRPADELVELLRPMMNRWSDFANG